MLCCHGDHFAGFVRLYQLMRAERLEICPFREDFCRTKLWYLQEETVSGLKALT